MQTLITQQGSAVIYKNWLDPNIQFSHLQNELIWQQEEITLFAKKIIVPRLVAWHGEPGIEYTYSQAKHIAIAWTPTLSQIKAQLTKQFNLIFNSVLGNFYRNGFDYMGWHADKEKVLGKNPTIASLSLGATRKFQFRHNISREIITTNLDHGDLLIMSDELQYHWQHRLPKESKLTAPRINLTFRQIVA